MGSSAYNVMMRAEASGLFWKFENAFREGGKRRYNRPIRNSAELHRQDDETRMQLSGIFISLLKIYGGLCALSALTWLFEMTFRNWYL